MYDKEVKRYKRRLALSMLTPILSIAILFIPISYFITVPLTVIAWISICLAMFISLVTLKADNILAKEMDPEKYAYIYYSLKMGDDRVDMLADLYRGRYKEAIAAAERAHNKSRLSVWRLEALFVLAHICFEIKDMERLVAVCNRIEALSNRGRTAKNTVGKNAFVISYYRSFAAGDYEACKRIKEECEASKDYKSSPILLSRMMLYYGIACHKLGDTEEARRYFHYIMGNCPKLYLSKIAESYLNEDSVAETEDVVEAEIAEEPMTEESSPEIPEDNTVAANVDGATEPDSLYDASVSAGDLIRQIQENKKGGMSVPGAESVGKRKGSKWGVKTFIIPAICLVLCIIIALVALLVPSGNGVSRTPKEAFEAIADNEDITRVVEIIPINDEGDALCIYVSDGAYNYGGVTYEPYYSQKLSVAYLDFVGDGLYRYGISSPASPQAEKRIDSSTYKIFAPDLNKAIFFKIVDNFADVPPCESYREFKIMEKTYYLCHLYTMDAESEDYACEKVDLEDGSVGIG